MVGKLGKASDSEKEAEANANTNNEKAPSRAAVIHVGCRAEEDSGDGMRWQREGASALHTDNYEVQSVYELKTKLCPA